MEDFNDKRQPNRTKLPRAPRNNAQRRPRRTANPQPAETESAVEVVVQPSRPQRSPRPQRTRRNPVPQAAAAAQAPQQNSRPRRRPAGRNHMQAVEAQPAIPMHICPLGGLGEVGKNITLYECQGDMILVDCGSVFPDNDMFGIDLVIPDFTYVLENKDRIKGLFITHGHEDHIGSLPYLLRQFNVPIYATKLTITAWLPVPNSTRSAPGRRSVWAALPWSPFT